MNPESRDLYIIEKMLKYCTQINEAHDEFGRSFSVFSSNSVYKNAVCMCLLQIGELSTKLSEEFKDNHKEIPWRQIRGMRNVVAHEYGNIDDETVWETVEDGVAGLIAFCKNVLNL